jgi:hypothetical protein
MSPPRKQDLDEALASPGALQLGVLEQRQRVKTWVHAGSAALFFIGMGTVLWLCVENPSKSEKAAEAAIAVGLLAVFQGILAISAHKQGRAMQTCREILRTKAEEQDPAS